MVVTPRSSSAELQVSVEHGLFGRFEPGLSATDAFSSQHPSAARGQPLAQIAPEQHVVAALGCPRRGALRARASIDEIVDVRKELAAPLRRHHQALADSALVASPGARARCGLDPIGRGGLVHVQKPAISTPIRRYLVELHTLPYPADLQGFSVHTREFAPP